MPLGVSWVNKPSVKGMSGGNWSHKSTAPVSGSAWCADAKVLAAAGLTVRRELASDGS